MSAKGGGVAVGMPYGGRAAAYFLHCDSMLEVAETRAAVLLFDRDAEHPELAEFGPQLTRELVAAVELGGQRCDPIAGEAAHALAQLLGGFAEVEIEAGEIVGDHGPSPAGAGHGRS